MAWQLADWQLHELGVGNGVGVLAPPHDVPVAERYLEPVPVVVGLVVLLAYQVAVDFAKNC